MTKIEADCPLCLSETAVVISQRARDGSAMTTILCEGCGLARSHPLPDAQELATFYRENYRLVYKATYQPKPYHVLRAARVAKDRMRRLGGFLRPGIRVLDVGCGGGEFLYLLRAAGCLVTGIEPNIGYAAFARDELGLDVRAGLTDDQKFPSGAFDGITLYHVLEHLPAPVETLRHVAEWLGAAGFLAVEVPNFESTCEHPAHRFHAAHLLHFSLPTLRRCGELAGLAMIHSEESEDGGNLFAVFRPDPSLIRSREPIPGAFERQWRIEKQRAAWRYWASPSTSARTTRRLWRMAFERLAARRYASRRAILDAIAGG
jgi:2-polyprenyl-3-methyl-5-hydroxy-6-metoxy-1,4-benzoquinol methylase